MDTLIDPRGKTEKEITNDAIIKGVRQVIDLVKSTDDNGHILLFIPGKNEILKTILNRCHAVSTFFIETASPVDRFLVFKKNPSKQLCHGDTDIVFHEIVHTISTRQNILQKQAITKQFLGKCPIQDKLQRLKILEEPMAVALGQILYLETYQPDKLKLEDQLYRDPWVNSFSKLIFPVLKTEITMGHKITDGVVWKMAKICLELVETSKQLAKPPEKHEL